MPVQDICLIGPDAETPWRSRIHVATALPAPSRQGKCLVGGTATKKPRWRDGHHRGGAPRLAEGKGNRAR
jgi:hypothetical protein